MSDPVNPASQPLIQRKSRSSSLGSTSSRSLLSKGKPSTDKPIEGDILYLTKERKAIITVVFLDVFISLLLSIFWLIEPECLSDADCHGFVCQADRHCSCTMNDFKDLIPSDVPYQCDSRLRRPPYYYLFAILWVNIISISLGLIILRIFRKPQNWNTDTTTEVKHSKRKEQQQSKNEE